VLATREVCEAAGPGFAWSPAGRRALQGVDEPVEVFEVRLRPSQRREPWPGYDKARVGEVRSELATADRALVRKVLEYERRHKRRKGVLDAASARLRTSD
jgi:hypothetical protein